MGHDRVGEAAALVEGQREGYPREGRPGPIRAVHQAEGERRRQERQPGECPHRHPLDVIVDEAAGKESAEDELFGDRHGDRVSRHAEQQPEQGRRLAELGRVHGGDLLRILEAVAGGQRHPDKEREHADGDSHDRDRLAAGSIVAAE